MTDEQCAAIMYTIRRTSERHKSDDPMTLMAYVYADLKYVKKTFKEKTYGDTNVKSSGSIPT